MFNFNLSLILIHILYLIYSKLMKLRFQQVTGQLTDTSRLRILRREIARMQTILREQPAAETAEGEA